MIVSFLVKFIKPKHEYLFSFGQKHGKVQLSTITAALCNFYLKISNEPKILTLLTFTESKMASLLIITRQVLIFTYFKNTTSNKNLKKLKKMQ